MDKEWWTPRKPRTRLQRRTPQEPPGLDDDKVRCIREVAAEHPRFTPEEVCAMIRYGQRRDDITAAMARYVLSAPPSEGMQ
jgi:hypothetical protein